MINFEALSQQALGRAHELLGEWLPWGRIVGNEWVCGSLRGDSGDSCKVNLSTGKWSDFATGEKGGDFVSLYAAINSISQVDAAKAVAERVGYTNGKCLTLRSKPKKQSAKSVVIPLSAGRPDFIKHGREPSKVWAYFNAQEELVFYVARYEVGGPGDKAFYPFSWSGSKFVNKMPQGLRPLYNLKILLERPQESVLVVEGEKAADAAIQLLGGIKNVVTWSGGANALDKTDWSPLYGKSVLLWPDQDEAGVNAMLKLAVKLFEHCPSVTILNVNNPHNPVKQVGFDAADALELGWDWFAVDDWIQVIGYMPYTLPTETKVELVANNDFGLVLSPDDGPLLESHKRLYELTEVTLNQSGRPHQNAANVARVLSSLKSLQDLVWYDEFYDRIRTTWNSKAVRDWTDADDIRMACLFQSKFGFYTVPISTVVSAIQEYVRRNVRNEPKDWMSGLVWDGQTRLDSFFELAMGAPTSIYIKEVSANFWISLAARTLSPGCKADCMIILEGPQGARKSTALEMIASKPWFAECNESVTHKDFYQGMRGKLLLEIAELGAFSRAETNAVKGVLTRNTDNYRPSYGRTANDYPRRCIFAGTTNDDHYLKDETGGRRFWPISCGKIDLEYIRLNREQLFAEAVMRFKRGDKWWETSEEAKEVQESRRDSDDWEDAIAEYISGRPTATYFRPSEIYEHLEIDIGKATRNDGNRLGKCMRVLGYRKLTIRVGDRTQRVWAKRS